MPRVPRPYGAQTYQALDRIRKQEWEEAEWRRKTYGELGTNAIKARSGSTIHHTVAKALNGSPGDFVTFEVVRISPSAGDVDYMPWAYLYGFLVCDEEGDEIIVAVDERDIVFEPKVGDFVRIADGRLKLLKDPSGDLLYILARTVNLTNETFA
jgi:hypothetical protein